MPRGDHLDNLFLFLQTAFDRLIRRLRLGRAPAPVKRRLLIVQIDGLSRAVFEQALANGHMRFVRRLLASGRHRAHPMAVGMPTSTPAFQMAAMYGVRPDIPGFHYHDKRHRSDIHFPRPGHAARVEAAHTEGRVGILRGGSVYGCVFTGGAENDLFSFAKLTRPSGPGLLRVLSGFIVVGWVALKSVALTAVEVAKLGVHCVTRPRTARRRWEWAKIKVGVSVWVRELFTAAVIRDLYGGVPAIYVNFLDHDVAAHAFGPRSRQAFRSLHYVDRSIRQMWRVMRRVPGHQYDLYLLSDHGQAASIPYRDLTGGQALERLFFDEFVESIGANGSASRDTRALRFAHGLTGYRIGEAGFLRRLTLDRRFSRNIVGREAQERGGVRIVSAGPNAFVYVVDTPDPLPIEEIDKRFPGLAARLSDSRGVGFVLARSESGPACFWRGERYDLAESSPPPFSERADRDLILRDLADLMAMPSAGDLVIYGTGAREGNVSFIPEVGAHAGPSPDELHTFIVTPARVEIPPITHPLQLYDLFMAYQETAAPAHRREL